MKLILTDKTPFKSWPYNSKVLTARGMPIEYKDRGEYEILDHFIWEGVKDSIRDDHIGILLPNYLTRYVWTEHCQIEGTEEGNDPKDEPDTGKGKTVLKIFNRGKMIKMPGINKKVGLNDLIIPGGHFRWREATNGGKRIPHKASITGNIIEMAEVMEEVRSLLGHSPITINSWYRDPEANRRVKGARRSRHLLGDATDFVVKGLKPAEVYDQLNSWWGSRGGLASSSIFTHIDARGYAARWRY